LGPALLSQWVALNANDRSGLPNSFGDQTSHIRLIALSVPTDKPEARGQYSIMCNLSSSALSRRDRPWPRLSIGDVVGILGAFDIY
jgi:hypothetical protein